MARVSNGVTVTATAAATPQIVFTPGNGSPVAEVRVTIPDDSPVAVFVKVSPHHDGFIELAAGSTDLFGSARGGIKLVEAYSTGGTGTITVYPTYIRGG